MCASQAMDQIERLDDSGVSDSLVGTSCSWGVDVVWLSLSFLRFFKVDGSLGHEISDKVVVVIVEVGVVVLVELNPGVVESSENIFKNAFKFKKRCCFNSFKTDLI